MSNDQQGYVGWAGLSSATSDFNKIWFMCRQLIGRVRTATIVQVMAVSNAGGIEPIGTVDVMPLVNMVDGLGNAYEHDTIFGLPYCRVQGGTNAVILDPQVGDVGLAVFADRDISAVKAAAQQGGGNNQKNPGSRRRHDWADGMYLFSLIAAAPKQFVLFNENGITIQDMNGNSILMNDTGVGIYSLNGSGVVNVIGSALQVNGVSLAVP